jgi:hypothetical protein
MASMNSWLTLDNPRNLGDKWEDRMPRSVHSLHHYTEAFWFQHLLEYTKHKDSIDDESLNEFLMEFRGILIRPRAVTGNLTLDDLALASEIKSRMKVLRETTQGQRIGPDILALCIFLAQEKQNIEATKSKS